MYICKCILMNDFRNLSKYFNFMVKETYFMYYKP